MKKINLLKRRREALNQNPSFDIAPSSKLLIKGSIIGCITVSPLIVIFFGIILFNQTLLFKRNNLQTFSDEYDLVQKKLIEENKAFNKVNNTNNILMDAISGIRSGSGLFLEINKITPKFIELKKIDVGKSGVRIIGISPQKNGLKVMNSYELSLARSPFFNKQNVKIIEASKFSRKDYSFIEKKVVNNNYLEFEIIAGFNNVQSVSSKYLLEIGSYGLAKRLNVIDEIKQK